MSDQKKIKIVVTGGPSAGKTTFLEVIQKEFARSVAIAPEAASILYRGNWPRPHNHIGRIYTQRAICSVQRELEDLLEQSSSQSLILCDRGSLDSIAYWPGPAEDFFASLKTSEAAELARYTAVIHFDTADSASFETTNPIRLESFVEAQALNLAIRAAWKNHPQCYYVGQETDFLMKLYKARKIVLDLAQKYNLDLLRV